MIYTNNNIQLVNEWCKGHGFDKGEIDLLSNHYCLYGPRKIESSIIGGQSFEDYRKEHNEKVSQ